VVIDATKDTVLANIPAAEGFYPRCVAVNPAGTNAYVTNQRDSANVAGSMSIIDVSTDTIVGTVEVGDNPLGITISPDGSKIYVVNLMNHQVSVINAGTNTIENTITVSSHPTQAAITADGSKLLVTASVDGYVDVVDTGTNSIIGDIGMSSPIGIVIVSPPSVALKVNDFTADVVSGTDPLTVHFTSDTSGNPNKWIWTFGKSSEETYKVGTVTHVFKQPGTYDVTLTIKNKSGQAMMTKKGFITVQRLKPPKASFIVDSAAGTAPLIVHFSDTSSNGPVKWLWSFGDGEFALIQNPIHKYDRPGKYTVTLLVENKAGIDAKIERGFITVVAKRR
jgi:YVTN family beta-propeller protein